MDSFKGRNKTYYVTFFTSVMSPIDVDMAFNSLLVHILEIGESFYHVKALFKDTKNSVHEVTLLIPFNNIAALIEVEGDAYQKLAVKKKAKNLEQVKKPCQVLRLVPKRAS